MSTAYRKDIDGLRLIAVLAVILFHYTHELLPGGYLGVDVFFAISGFVITQKLLAERDKAGQISLAGFFLGRMKRLLPALLMMIVPTMFAISFLAGDFGEQDYVEVIDNAGMAAIFGLSNFVLYAGASDYFSQNAELNPFTHTWSLAVEEQFYLLFPLLLLLGARGGRSGAEYQTFLIRLLGIVALLSFAGSLLLHDVDFSLTFYMLPFRMWELALGCLLAIYMAKRAPGKPIRNSHVIAGLCLVALLASFIVTGIDQIILQLVSVVAAVGLIYAGHGGNWVAQLLSVRPVVYGGKLSYSLYLWHWPLLVLAKWSIGVSGVVLLALGGMTFLFAALSYHFVEQPLRRRTLQGTKLIGILKMQGVSVAALLIILFGNQLVTEDMEFHAPALMGIEPAVSWGQGLACHDSNVTKTMPDPIGTCVKPSRTPEKPYTLFLVGESHAAQLIFGVDEALKDTNYERRYFWSGDQTATFPYTFFDQGQAPAATLDKIIDWAVPGDVVLFTYHRGWVNDERDNHLQGPNDQLNDKSLMMQENLKRMIARLSAHGVNIVLSLDGPLVARRVSVHSCALQQKWSGRSVCAIDRDQDEITRRQQELLFGNLSAEFDNVVVYDPFDAIYGDRAFIDVLGDDGQWIMYDYNHISHSTSLGLAGHFKQALQDANFLKVRD